MLNYDKAKSGLWLFWNSIYTPDILETYFYHQNATITHPAG